MTNLSRSRRIIDSPWTFVVAMATIGPFALPLLWRNPRYSARTKLLLSLVVLAVTAGLLWLSGSVFKDAMDAYRLLQELNAVR